MIRSHRARARLALAAALLATTAVVLALPFRAGAAAPVEFWLVDPAIDARVRMLADGEILTEPFAMEAVGTGGSIEFWLDGSRGRLENNPPFTPFDYVNGDFAAADLPAGEHLLEAHVYSARQKGGTFLGMARLRFTVQESLPMPAPSEIPTPAPSESPTLAPSPTPGSTGDNVSGIVIPAPLPGYERVGFTEFPNETQLGDGLHPDTLRLLQPRPNVAGDCTYRDSSGRGVYCTRRTTYESGGLLRQWLHTEDAGQSGIFHVPNGNVNYVSGLKWTLPNQDDFVVSFVARFNDIPGRKVAYLRWCGPRIGTPGYCEDNFPEAKLTPGTCKGNAFHHHESRRTQNAYQLCIDLNDWHLYMMHVKPGQFVEFYLDEVLIGHATQDVSSRGSYYVFQSETYLGGQALPFPHRAGWIEFDAVAFDLPD